MTRDTILARLALAAALAMPLAACGEDKQTTNTPPPAAPAAAPAAPAEPEVGMGAPATTTAPPPATGAEPPATTTTTGTVPPPSPADPAASVDQTLKDADKALDKVEPKPQGQ